MKQKKKFLVGSRYFFDGIEGFRPKDTDYMYIMDDFRIKGTNILRMMHINGEDKFLLKDVSKEEFIKDAIGSTSIMKIGKFFVSGFAEYIGLTIDDLKIFEEPLKHIDSKHAYYQDIYNAYIENNAFTLTDEQRLKAYETYKKARNI